jgi:hypothetical protein
MSGSPSSSTRELGLGRFLPRAPHVDPPVHGKLHPFPLSGKNRFQIRNSYQRVLRRPVEPTFKILVYASLALPLPLLAIAWTRNNRKPIEFSILTLDAVLLFSATVRSLKLTLLGIDYSNRFFTTIGVNMLAALVLCIYLGVKRRAFAALAA